MICIILGKKLTCRLGGICLRLWDSFDNDTSFFAALWRFWPNDAGDQLPGCLLFSRYDICQYIIPLDLYIYNYLSTHFSIHYLIIYQ